MNKHFIRTADQETANILKSIGFPQVGYTKGIYTCKLFISFFCKCKYRYKQANLYRYLLCKLVLLFYEDKNTQ